ncbi:choice-of-anchor M domain-containing protein [Actinoalloteichus caeruleus]|uniref:choice-of-anchor M domain-containing protein n=1 Tax=Actinoalloteichus cyanogriseus TaxID=2893586 RepID=UPI0004BFC012|nr:choice-of-anchor M domain-containing protein [Actinoalloteichus caeruleus]
MRATTPRTRRTWTALIAAAATATLPGAVLATASPLGQEALALTRSGSAAGSLEAQEATDPPVLLATGSVELQARLDGSSLSAGFTDTSDPEGPVRYGPAEAALHVPAAAETVQPPHHPFPADPGDAVWTLPAAGAEGLPRVALSTRGVDRAEVTGRVGLGLETLSGPGEVAVFVTATGDRPPSAVRWNSRDGLPDVHEYPPDRDERLTWSFSAEGTYCLGVRTTATPGSGAEVTGLDVLTVVVGDVSPGEVRTCGADQPAPEDPVLVLDRGHVDAVYPRLVDDELRLQLRDGTRLHDDEEVMREFDDVVLHAGTASRTTIPEGSVADWLGRPAGDPMWLLPQTSRPDVLWAGWGSDIRWHEEVVLGSLDWRLDHVTGPGNLAMYLSSAARDGAPPVFVSRGGSPNVRMMSVPAHTHANWAFTEEGVYCLTFSASGTLLDGRTVSDRQRLTLAVGDVAAEEVVPCGRSGPAPEREPRESPTEPAGDPVVLGGHTSSELSARFVDGELRLDVRSNRDATDPRYHSPSDVVLHTTESATVPASGFTGFLGEPGERYWRFRSTQGAGWPVLGLDTADVLPDQVDGGTLTWRVHDAGGPGDVAFYAVGRGGTRILDTVGGEHASVRTRAHGTQVREWAFVGAGTYCVDVEVSATRADGRAVSDRQLVTVVAGDADPSAVTPCGRDDDGPPPDTPTPPPSDELVVLDEGHVDVAARVREDELRMAVKDGTTPGVVEWRELEDVLFHANPDSGTTVPDAPAYDFLGGPGDPVWILPQTQLEGVLWPGWNTEEILPDQLAGAVHWRLTAAEGPGAFVLYQDGTFGPNDPVLDSRDALPTGFDVPLGQHAHANWAFTAEGVYCLSFTMSATTPAGGSTSDGGTLAVAVGEVDVTSVPRCGEGDDPGPSPTPPPSTSPPPGPGDPGGTPPPTTTAPSHPGGGGPGGGPGSDGPGGGGPQGGGGGLAWTGTGSALPLAVLGGLLLVLGGLVWWFGRTRSRTPTG